MNVRILDEADDELTAAVAYYEDAEAGLGIRLKQEARSLILWITNNPELPRLRPKGYRRVNFKTFQHYIAYVVLDDTIWIVAIAHARQRPEYWLKRKKLIG